VNGGSLVLRFLPIGALAAIALACNPLAPRLDRARMAAQEMAAIAAIKNIQTAEISYYSQFNKYACSLAELGPPADMIAADLASGKKNGYLFKVTCRQDGYTVTAMPESFNLTGTRTFYADESLAIHEHRGPETATSQDPELK
jgi:hypothetical protein